ncbi:SGNH/GDSL hydrolase family protein [Sphingomonas sp. GM_Shp_2]|uniref:SGNH/GDSL hydrolase family protein n=1 Tax=Sphingomonas sp. GM_Shp_2 TaxID=2937380 RepID=UPI00226A6C99|nr:SGNH/GDSL hydrolase family protein [Sphingomonas sp. GM_Shp_2]
MRYVAIGSSFAAGPGVASSADTPANRCARSNDNYPHLLARRLRLQLTDVSCSGATTAHVVGPWNELPPQLDALTSDTGLVTITIGGNDVGYIGTLGAASCRSFAVPPPGAPGGKCPEPPRVSEADWTKLDGSLRQIIAEVRRRAPKARLVFVDYLSVLPAVGRCAATPMSAEQAGAGRAIATRLAAITRRAAAKGGAEVLRASDVSQNHDACSAQPWVSGFPLPGSAFFVPYHPNAQGMAAIADRLTERIGRRG